METKDGFIIISKPEDMERFFPVGTKLIVEGIKMEVVEDLCCATSCDGCPFDLNEDLDTYCQHAVCQDGDWKDDESHVFIKFKKMEG